MSLRQVGGLLLLSLALLGVPGGIAPAAAQNSFDPFFFLRPPAPIPQQGSRHRNNGWWPFQQRRQQIQPQDQAPAARRAPVRKREAEPEGAVYNSADAAIRGKRQPPKQFVLVMGDDLGDQVAQGLADAYLPERDRVAVIGSFVDGSGFLPKPEDWIAKFPAAFEAARPDVTVVVLGDEDLQPLDDNGFQVQPLTDRWIELYARRVDAVLAALRAKTGRVIVVGLVPVSDNDLSGDYARLNEVIRARAARAGFPFANVWDGFVDEDGKFLATGPAVDGQRRRLRFNDGVRFTRDGRRKLAFFVQKDLDRLLEDPAKASAALGGDERALSLAGAPEGAEAKPATGGKPAEGLASAKVLHSGISPVPVRGRTDDFSWPPPTLDSLPQPARSSTH